MFVSNTAFVYETLLLFTMAQRSAAEARWARVGGVGRQGSALYITRYPCVLYPVEIDLSCGGLGVANEAKIGV